VVVLPAYNASRTLARTYAEIPRDLVDEVILCDDASRDNTVETALQLGIEHVIRHEQNRGYGGNQRLCIKRLLRSMAISSSCSTRITSILLS
jgi:glycosyltransferase involved in cell wall biosynthesis